MRRLIPFLSETPPKRATPAKRAAARNARISWRRRLSAAGLAAALSAGLSLAAFVAVSDQPMRAWRATEAAALAWTARRGLVVADIQAQGRQRTGGGDLLRALGVSRETPILGIDLVDAKRRVESLPWVAHAEVERLLPHTLRIVISERVPVAISQNGGRSVLIDASGTEIVPVAAQAPGLPIVTGRGAPQAVAELLAEIAPFPEIAARVKAAPRVGDRRWVLKLDAVEGGIEVRLPETGSAAAWGRLAELDRKHRLLSRDVALIDLRLPDRMVVRLANGKTLPPPDLGQPRKGGRSA